jgi:hypothetical protein
MTGHRVRCHTDRMPDHPTMALVLPDQRIEPGGRVLGDLWLHGGGEPLAIDQLCARVWARVYADFDDDGGAAHVRLFDGVIAEDVHLGAEATVETDVRLPVPWSAPVTRSNGVRLRGLSVMVEIWGVAAVAVDCGIHQIDVDPLPWQQRLLTTCERSGLRWETNLARPGDQHIDSCPRDGRSHPEVSLSWRVHRRWVTVELHGRRRRPFSVRLTHTQATRMDWAGQLSDWLAAPD